jgi:putative membrane protein
MAQKFGTPVESRWVLIGIGALAGTIATLPMTLFMLLMQRMLPRSQHYDLPPEKLTDELIERAGVKKYTNKPMRTIVALIAHFSYGAVTGVIYPLLRRDKIPSSVQGITFGLIVWFASYLGLLPTLQVSTTAPKEPIQRNILMIIAHTIWGATLGVSSDLLSRWTSGFLASKKASTTHRMSTNASSSDMRGALL